MRCGGLGQVKGRNKYQTEEPGEGILVQQGPLPGLYHRLLPDLLQLPVYTLQGGRVLLFRTKCKSRMNMYYENHDLKLSLQCTTPRLPRA